MNFKKYSTKSHYKVHKLVRFKKLTIFKNLIEVSNTNETTKVLFFLNVILNSKRQNLELIKHSLLKSHTLIKLGLFRFKTCPKK